jgi:hypothetical protein
MTSWRAGPENWIGDMRFPPSVSVAGPRAWLADAGYYVR